MQDARPSPVGHKSRLELESEDTKQFDDEKIDKLQIQIAKLDTDARELIMLRFYSKMSFKEIAKMRREPIGTTLSKVHRTMKKLKELME